ncbi:RNA-binding protein 12 isoform X2 [Serinus canaria]|uniref:RNA-binding protein 12 isoform X2 n=1 Tax=Serinus canaria TaxID=9135 RepID=UPI0021CCFCAC|nr:RNA-binding protein 12 isoform X2 [Serinus canaria]
MAVVIRLQGLPIVAGTMDIRHFFSGLTIPDGGVHIVGGELDGRVPVPGGAVRGLPEPPRRGPELQVDPLCVLLQDAGDGRWAEITRKRSRTAKTLNSARNWLWTATLRK